MLPKAKAYFLDGPMHGHIMLIEGPMLSVYYTPAILLMSTVTEVLGKHYKHKYVLLGQSVKKDYIYWYEGIDL